MANELTNEQLTEDQLDGVAGGTESEITKDAILMQVIGMCDTAPSNYDDIQRMWARVGISFIVHRDGSSNEYFDSKGNPIVREAALKQALKKSRSKLDLKAYL